ncbi:MAG: glycosyltransferase family 9 protein [Nitrospira sp.]
MYESPRTILLIHPGGFGDVLLAVPAMRVLRGHYPQHEIGLLAASDIGRFLHMSGEVDQIFPIEEAHLTELMADQDGRSSALAQWLQRGTIAVGWLHDRDRALHTALQAQGISQIVVQSPAGESERHQSDRFLSLLRRLGIIEKAEPLVLTLPGDIAEEGRTRLIRSGVALNARTIICHPGSGSRHKCVAPQLWSEFLHECLRLQWTPVVVAGAADEWVLETEGWRNHNRVPVIRSASITQLAGLLANAQGYLGHDTGVTHLAAMLGVPTIAMFGPTDPHRWAPQGAHVTVLRGEVCGCHGWDEVQACTEKPCLAIKVADVVAALQGIAPRYHRVTNS